MHKTKPTPKQSYQPDSVSARERRRAKHERTLKRERDERKLARRDPYYQ